MAMARSSAVADFLQKEMRLRLPRTAAKMTASFIYFGTRSGGHPMSSFGRYILPRAVAVALVMTLAGPGIAQTVVPISWTGGASGSWFTAGNWSPAGVPDNYTGPNNVSEYAATIGGSSSVNVTLDYYPGYNYFFATVDSLNLSAGNSTLTVGLPNYRSSLQVTNADNGNFTVAAGSTVLLGAGIAGSSLSFLGSVALQGGGTITLKNQNCYIATGATTFTITNGLTIDGSGYIGEVNSSNSFSFHLVNQSSGVISADDPNRGGMTLSINGDSTNAGTLRASNGNVLNIVSAGSLTNTGTISALNGSGVTLGNGIFRCSGNGQFTTAGTGLISVASTIQGQSVVFDGTTSPFVNNGVLQTGYGTTIRGTFSNNGTVTVGSGGLTLGPSVTLTGGGTFAVNSFPIYVPTAGCTFTNASTIVGPGSLGLSPSGQPGTMVLINQPSGTINSNLNSRTLRVFPNGASSNAGILEASNGGILAITCQNQQGTATASLTNSGTIAAMDGSTVTLNYVGGFAPSPFSIVGGPGNQFMTAGTGVIQGSDILLDGSASPIVNAGTFQDALLVQLKGTLTNNGTFTVLAGKYLPLDADATVNGSGSLTLVTDSLGNAARMPAFSGSRTLTNASTINGTGFIGGDPNGNGFGNLAIVNQAGGLIDANSAGQTLTIQPNPSLSNAGTLRASSGGTLSLIGGGTLTNTGTIAALAGSTVDLHGVQLTNFNAGTLTGGTYSATGAGSAILLGSNASVTTLSATVTLAGGRLTDQLGNSVFANLATITNVGSLSVSAGSTESIAPVLIVNGTLAVGSGGTITVGGLAGSGTVTVAAGSNLTIQTAAAGASFGGTIGGVGGLTFNGTGAQTLTGTNSFAGGTNILNGTVAVPVDAALGTGNITGGAAGTLSYTGSTSTTRSFNMNSGTVTIASGQMLTFNGSQIVSTFLDGSGTFATNAAGGVTFNNVTTTPSVTVVSNSSADRFVRITNGGALTVAAGLTTPMPLSGFDNQGSGSVMIGQNSQVNVSNFQSSGTLTLNPGSFNGSTGNVTQITNTGGSPLYFNDGSRTFISTAAQTANQNAGIDLHGNDAIVAGGLFVNNGFVYDSTGGNHRVVADYGTLVKGAGFWQPLPKTINGGTFIAGNSPGRATAGKIILGGPKDPNQGLSNYTWEINDAGPSSSYPNAPGVAGPQPNAAGLVSGWGLLSGIIRTLPPVTTGNFLWDATPTDQFVIHLSTMQTNYDAARNPVPSGGYEAVGDNTLGLLADFDPTQSYSWRLFSYAGTYTGPTDTASLDASTIFDDASFLNAHPGRFDWVLNQTSQEMDLVYTPTAVPEPGTLWLVAAAGLACSRRLHRHFV
jgi:hypothetical protein